MKILLDTNAYSGMRRGDPWAVGELLFGFRNGARLVQNLEKLEGFLARPEVGLLSVTRETADLFGQIAAALRRKGRPIPTNDIWIAAHAMEAGAELISADFHFGEIEGLAWEMP